MITIVKNLYNLLYNKYYAECTFGDDVSVSINNNDVNVSISNNENHDEFMIDGLELILLKVIKL